MEKYFDVSYIWSALPDLIPYLWVTLYIAAFSVIGGSLLGLVLAAAKLSNNQFFRALANGYTTIIRCTPSIVLLFLVYYGIPAFSEGLFGIYLQNVSTGVFVVVTFSLQFGAMMSEVIRSSYLAIARNPVSSVSPYYFPASTRGGITELWEWLNFGATRRGSCIHNWLY